jgi:hypothetical protein
MGWDWLAIPVFPFAIGRQRARSEATPRRRSGQFYANGKLTLHVYGDAESRDRAIENLRDTIAKET